MESVTTNSDKAGDAVPKTQWRMVMRRTTTKKKPMSDKPKVVDGKDPLPTSRPRVTISDLGEYYYDLLTIEARLKNRTLANESNSLICAKLMERAPTRERMLKYLAWKRGITEQEVIRLILADKLGPINPADIPPDLAGEI